jgi:hypothetical protein
MKIRLPAGGFAGLADAIGQIGEEATTGPLTSPWKTPPLVGHLRMHTHMHARVCTHTHTVTRTLWHTHARTPSRTALNSFASCSSSATKPSATACHMSDLCGEPRCTACKVSHYALQPPADSRRVRKKKTNPSACVALRTAATSSLCFCVCARVNDLGEGRGWGGGGQTARA